jgi:GNAT superfamily N-acetyltransferase/RimJ/RimL family protein N-acetyltransferase
MKTYLLRSAELERDFGQLAAWFSILEDEPNTESDLKRDYEKDQERISLRVAEDEQGELLGFYWAIRDRLHPERTFFNLFVKPERRGQGIGRQLYEDLARSAEKRQAKILRAKVWDTSPEHRVFAERHGFSERYHMIAMVLNLEAFDDRPYTEIIARLKAEGIEFTSMEELGNTEEAQRKLYTLNDSTAITTPGTDGEHPWDSFEDFQQSVCQSNWYKPAGQMVAIDTATGAWAAMSAITRWEGCDYAYNLFTGVDMLYRGRKLGQAVKVIALRFGRDVLKVNEVRTHHNAKNLPMIAIDRKLGYGQLSGTFTMEKILA